MAAGARHLRGHSYVQCFVSVCFVVHFVAFAGSGEGLPDAGPRTSQNSLAELFYLQHSRPFCIDASGCNSIPACSVGSNGGPGGCGGLGWCPAGVSWCLGVVYAVVSTTDRGGVRLVAAAAASPGFWLPVAEASGAVFWAGLPLFAIVLGRFRSVLGCSWLFWVVLGCCWLFWIALGCSALIYLALGCSWLL